MERCRPAKSASHFKSFVEGNIGKTLAKVPKVKLDDNKEVKARFEKACPKQCSQERFVLSAAYQPISQSLKVELDRKATEVGQVRQEFAILNIFVNSLEYEQVRNFPLHGLQFLAEVIYQFVTVCIEWF